jgi:hypothetical protein
MSNDDLAVLFDMRQRYRNRGKLMAAAAIQQAIINLKTQEKERVQQQGFYNRPDSVSLEQPQVRPKRNGSNDTGAQS